MVQLVSVVVICAPTGPAGPDGSTGSTEAVHMSYGDRNTLKSSTSAEALPSRKRTLTAFVEVVVLTIDNSVL